jgi:capsular exopolysaccharide synthesis family protein
MVKKIKKVAEESGSAYKFGKELDFASAEAYNLLKTNISFSIPDTLTGKVIGITSPCPQEGKSTTSINLCYAIAEAGHTVVLVDSDMRRPSVAGALNIPSAPGLSNILAEDATGAVRKNILSEKMSVITSGDIPPNPAEFVSSDKMKRLIEKLREEYEYVIIDLPPVNSVSDPLAVSKYTDGIVIVVRHNHTKRKDVLESIRQLRLVNAKIIGFVYNSAKIKSTSKEKYKKYY